jgi:DNA-binding NarL/FixJ family response regulator
VAHYYYTAVFQFFSTAKPTALPLLTQQEMTCLTMQAHYFSVEHIAKELKIKPRTVHFHFQNANKKLGVANKFDAVNKALELGIIVK